MKPQTHLHDGAGLQRQNVNGRRPYGRDEGRQYGRWGGAGGWSSPIRWKGGGAGGAEAAAEEVRVPIWRRVGWRVPSTAGGVDRPRPYGRDKAASTDVGEGPAAVADVSA